MDALNAFCLALGFVEVVVERFLRFLAHAVVLLGVAGLLAVSATWLLLFPLEQSPLTHVEPLLPTMFILGATVAMVGGILHRKGTGILPGGMADVARAFGRTLPGLIVCALLVFLMSGLRYVAGLLGAPEDLVSVVGYSTSAIVAKCLFEAFCDWTRVPSFPAADGTTP